MSHMNKSCHTHRNSHAAESCDTHTHPADAPSNDASPVAPDERWGAGVEYHFQEFNQPYAPS